MMKMIHLDVIRQADLRAQGAQAGGWVGDSSAVQGRLSAPEPTRLVGDKTLHRLPLMRLNRIVGRMSVYAQGKPHAGACCRANRGVNCTTQEQRLSTLYIGVDMSKARFDVEAIHEPRQVLWHRSYPNTARGSAQLWRKSAAAQAERVQVCMEATGA